MATFEEEVAAEVARLKPRTPASPPPDFDAQVASEVARLQSKAAPPSADFSAQVNAEVERLKRRESAPFFERVADATTQTWAEPADYGRAAQRLGAIANVPREFYEGVQREIISPMVRESPATAPLGAVASVPLGVATGATGALAATPAIAATVMDAVQQAPEKASQATASALRRLFMAGAPWAPKTDGDVQRERVAELEPTMVESVVYDRARRLAAMAGVGLDADPSGAAAVMQNAPVLGELAADALGGMTGIGAVRKASFVKSAVNLDDMLPAIKYADEATPLAAQRTQRGVVPVKPTASSLPDEGSALRPELIQPDGTRPPGPAASELVAGVSARRGHTTVPVARASLGDGMGAALAAMKERTAAVVGKFHNPIDPWMDRNVIDPVLKAVDVGSSKIPGVAKTKDVLRDWLATPQGDKYGAEMRDFVMQRASEEQDLLTEWAAVMGRAPDAPADVQEMLTLRNVIAGTDDMTTAQAKLAAALASPTNKLHPLDPVVESAFKGIPEVVEVSEALGRELARYGDISEVTRASRPTYQKRYYTAEGMNAIRQELARDPEFVAQMVSAAGRKGRAQGLSEAAASKEWNRNFRSAMGRATLQSARRVNALRFNRIAASNPEIAVSPMAQRTALTRATTQQRAVQVAVEHAAEAGADAPRSWADVARTLTDRAKMLRDEFEAAQKSFAKEAVETSEALTTRAVDAQQELNDTIQLIDAIADRAATAPSPTADTKSLLSEAAATVKQATAALSGWESTAPTVTPSGRRMIPLADALMQRGIVSDVAAAQKMANDSRFGALAGGRIAEDKINDVLLGAGVATPGVELLKESTKWYEMMLTAFNIATHPANVIANAATNHVGGYSIGRQWAMNGLSRAGLVAQDATAQAARSLGLNVMDVWSDPKFRKLFGEFQDLKNATTGGSVEKVTDAMRKFRERVGTTKVLQLLRAEDDVARFGHYLDAIISRGMSADEAVKSANFFVPTSFGGRSKLAQKVRWFRPFAHYGIEAGKILAHAAVHNPIKLSAVLASPYLVDDLAVETGELRPGEPVRRERARPWYENVNYGPSLYQKGGEDMAALSSVLGAGVVGGLAALGARSAGLPVVRTAAKGAGLGALTGGAAYLAATTPKSATVPALGAETAMATGGVFGYTVGGAPGAALGAMTAGLIDTVQDNGKPVDWGMHRVLPGVAAISMANDPVAPLALSFIDIVRGRDPMTGAPLMTGAGEAASRQIPIIRQMMDAFGDAKRGKPLPVWVARWLGGTSFPRSTQELEARKAKAKARAYKQAYGYEGRTYEEFDPERAAGRVETLTNE